MPALGMNQEMGKLVAWLRREGEAVTKGEPLMEVETDKAVVEVEAPATGVLAGVSAHPGDEVPVGQRIAIILAVGETVLQSAKPAASPKAKPAASPKAKPAASPEAKPAASPKAKLIAAERAIDLGKVVGSGPGGAVKAGDLPALPQHAPSTAPGSRGIWQTMARRTTESWTSVPHFYIEREVDAGRLQSWRASVLKEGTNVTFTDLLVRLVAACLRRHPRVNGRWDGEASVPNTNVNVGIAAAVDQGLVVPVIHGADTLKLAEIASRRRDLIEKARAGRLRLEDMQDGTFTLSNLGMYKVDAFAAIVNQPQAAILAVGRIAERVVAVAGSAQIRPTMRLTLSCDHRAIDGARAAEFLTDLGDLIEEPAVLL